MGVVKLPLADGVGVFEASEVSASRLLSSLVASRLDVPRLRELVPEGGRVFVGRPGPFGNPFSHRPSSAAGVVRVGSVEEAVERFSQWILEDEQAALLERVRLELRRKVLVCHCQRWHESSPLCHAEVLVRLANPDLVELERREREAVLAARVAFAEAQERDAVVRRVRLDFVAADQFIGWVRELGVEDWPRVLVCGDRNFRDWSRVMAFMTELRDRTAGEVVVLQGEGRGADSLARDCALRVGLPVAGFPAQWDVGPDTPPWAVKVGRDGRPFDRRAGMLRNRLMLAVEPVQAFGFHDWLPKSRGTKSCLREAWLQGVFVTMVESDGRRHLGRGTPSDTPPVWLRGEFESALRR